MTHCQIFGVNLTSTDVIAMLQLCSYETHALGYSAFCDLFSAEDFINYEYYFDLVSSPNDTIPNTVPQLQTVLISSV
jgi:hypothetical protein